MIRVLTIFTVVFLTGCATTPKPDSLSSNPFEINLLSQNNEPEWAKTALSKHFREWEAVRYRYGGLSKQGVDCSGFVYLTFLNQFGVKLPRNTSLQVKIGETVSQDQLKTGDLVFFKTHSSQHVGIYLENRKFIHASSSRGVTTSSLDSKYWSTAYWTARRLDSKLLHSHRS